MRAHASTPNLRAHLTQVPRQTARASASTAKLRARLAQVPPLALAFLQCKSLQGLTAAVARETTAMEAVAGAGVHVFTAKRGAALCTSANSFIFRLLRVLLVSTPSTKVVILDRAESTSQAASASAAFQAPRVVGLVADL
eukprot:CAMPEP_0115296826 /NCGR_PEP_ID=MMETSP0270-20121206/67434_1 /TAXON_ID=71861 /ORGANISM="Scrippsiella trochoidea, Strain CCMP3099" /LENGTH=139 /DNA_ID=CAMNT_0002714467 /DNA_START=56 /DNA_END=475 /DNA_ORIENTATION=+